MGSQLQELGKLIELKAEKIENGEADLGELVRNRDYNQVVMACEDFVDWEGIIADYQRSTLDYIIDEGTEFSYTRELKEFIEVLCRVERSRRDREPAKEAG